MNYTLSLMKWLANEGLTGHFVSVALHFKQKFSDVMYSYSYTRENDTIHTHLSIAFVSIDEFKKGSVSSATAPRMNIFAIRKLSFQPCHLVHRHSMQRLPRERGQYYSHVHAKQAVVRYSSYHDPTFPC